MDLFGNLLLGFGVALTPENILYCFVGATIGTGGATLIGAVFSHVVRGFGFGLAGSAAYIVARKGKDLDLPAQTGMLIRMDNTVTVPVTSASNASLTGGSR